MTTSGNRVLIIDDEVNMRHMLATMLSKGGYITEAAGNGAEALSIMDERDFDFVLCDIRMPKMDGMSFLATAKEKYPEITIIMMSAYGTIETALEAMKKGAYDYISKPFKTDEVLLALKKAKERDQLKEENLMLQGRLKKLEQKYSFGNVVAGSEAMEGVFDLVDRVADFKTTVLITGESGTGKELIAKEIHSRGRRSSFNMVAINCAGIPETLLESELFGYKKGAFTDASRDKPGLFMQANKGTIFLDEIGEMPFPLQAKLLRILQEEEVTPLGGTTPEKTDARVIAATSKDLEYEVKEGRFREDLFYRINVMTIHLPPLRERRSDIPLLTSHFIDIFNNKLGKNVEGLSQEAMALLMGHSWSGNIRELENVIERAIILSKGKLLAPAELPPSITAGRNRTSVIEPGDTLSIKKATKSLEQELIEKALKLTGGNKSKAAQILEISRPILIAKIKEYDIT
jgi:two-component system, NtrC family, response regulator AtoC